MTDATILGELLAIAISAVAVAFLAGRLIERRTQAALRSLTPRPRTIADTLAEQNNVVELRPNRKRIA